MTKTLIAMLHVPVNTALAAPEKWQHAVGAPTVTMADFQIIREFPDIAGQPDLWRAPEGLLDRLGFVGALRERMSREAETYLRHGVGALMLENVAAPYFVRGEQPPVIYWVMRTLAECLRAEYPDVKIGIQILAHSDDWAMDIACRCGLDFIRCESALFEGLRPEGRTPNHGNLAQLYMMRQRLLAESGDDRREPQVYVDLQKKHTAFPAELQSLDVWLENILFQKLEGLVITGRGTGCPVDERDLKKAREAIEEAKAKTSTILGQPWVSPLLVGSGACVENIGMCKQYADGVIVGSSLKRHGYWECPLDEERITRFMDAWHA
jgi:uncharacterized protein